MKKNLFSLLAVIFIAMCIVYILPSGSVAAQDSNDPIVLAVVGPMTGAGAAQGLYAESGAIIAAEKINESGGVNGRMIEIIGFDDKGDPAEAALVAQRIVDDERIFAVVGHMWSSCTLAALQIYADANMPVLAPSSSNNQVTALGYMNLIRMCHRESVFNPAVAGLIVNNFKHENIALFYPNDDFGLGNAQVIKAKLDELGAKIVYEAPFKPNQDKDFTVQITAALKAGADAIFTTAQQTEAGLIASQMSQLDAWSQITHMFTTNAVLYQVFLDRIDENAANHIVVTSTLNIFADRPAVQDFNEAFFKIQEASVSETASNSHDAVLVIAETLRNGATRDNLIETIKMNTYDGLYIGDNIKWNEKGDRTDYNLYAIGIKDGKFYDTGIVADTTGVSFD